MWAYVDETDIGRIRVGQRARFTVDTFGNEEFDGEVRQIYPQPEIRDNVVDYVTVVRFRPEAGERLRPEMTTSVRIATERAARRPDRASSAGAPRQSWFLCLAAAGRGS